MNTLGLVVTGDECKSRAVIFEEIADSSGISQTDVSGNSLTSQIPNKINNNNNALRRLGNILTVNKIEFSDVTDGYKDQSSTLLNEKSVLFPELSLLNRCQSTITEGNPLQNASITSFLPDVSSRHSEGTFEKTIEHKCPVEANDDSFSSDKSLLVDISKKRNYHSAFEGECALQTTVCKSVGKNAKSERNDISLQTAINNSEFVSLENLQKSNHWKITSNDISLPDNNTQPFSDVLPSVCFTKFSIDSYCVSESMDANGVPATLSGYHISGPAVYSKSEFPILNTPNSASSLQTEISEVSVVASSSTSQFFSSNSHVHSHLTEKQEKDLFDRSGLHVGEHFLVKWVLSKFSGSSSDEEVSTDKTISEGVVWWRAVLKYSGKTDNVGRALYTAFYEPLPCADHEQTGISENCYDCYDSEQCDTIFIDRHKLVHIYEEEGYEEEGYEEEGSSEGSNRFQVLTYRRPGEDDPEEEDEVMTMVDFVRYQQETDREEGGSAEEFMMEAFKSLPVETQMNTALAYRLLADRFLEWCKNRLDSGGVGTVITKLDIQQFMDTLKII